MSTRANIIVKDDYGQVIFYRHSDGYPEGTLPTLNKFLDLVKSGKVRDNVSQSCGWLVVLGALEYGTIKPEMICKKYDTPDIKPQIEGNGVDWKVGAYEPADALSGDIEYLYTVDLMEKEIEIEKRRGY